MSTCFFFNDTATTEIYTLSLHDALPISAWVAGLGDDAVVVLGPGEGPAAVVPSEDEPFDGGDEVGHGRKVAAAQRLAGDDRRSEEHTSELQSRQYLVCRLLLEKKKNALW